MTTMKKLFSMMMLATAMLFAFTACKDDDEGTVPTFDAPELNAVSTAYQQIPGEVVNIQLNANAESGIKSIAVSGAATGTVNFTAGDDNQLVTYPFTVPADAEEGEAFALTFTLTDDEDRTAAANVTVTATATPEEPGTEITLTTGTNSDGLASFTGFDAATNTLLMEAKNTYILDGFVWVNDGQTLVIEPGTLIQGRPGQGEGASALIVARGGMIMAEGTADAPIVMTARADDLQGSLADDDKAFWGGLIILGKGPTNNLREAEGLSIEGLPAPVVGDEASQRSRYGGTEANDNSGILKYVSIRHGGSVIGANNEINGLTLGAVGSGTTIEFIEIWSNEDDGVEFFGGNVNVKNMVISWVGDDCIDYDEGFSGNSQFVLAWPNTVKSSDPRGGEHDGGTGSNERDAPFAIPNFHNITYLGGDEIDLMVDAIIFRDNAGGKYFNSIFYNLKGGINVEDLAADANPDSYTRFQEGDLLLENNIFYNVNNVTSQANIANIFYLSGAPEAGNETAFKTYGAEQNTVIDPEFGTGGTAVVPSAAAINENLATPSGDFFETVDYKGAFEPGTEAWISGWTKAWEVLNK